MNKFRLNTIFISIYLNLIVSYKSIGFIGTYFTIGKESNHLLILFLVLYAAINSYILQLLNQYQINFYEKFGWFFILSKWLHIVIFYTITSVIILFLVLDFILIDLRSLSN